MVLPFLPLWIGFPLGFAVFYAGHWHWGIAAGIVIVSLLGAVLLFRWAFEQRRGLDMAFGQAQGAVVWVFAINWIHGESPPHASTVVLGLSDGSICKVRLHHGVLVGAVEKALVDFFPNAVFGFRDEFPAAFSADPFAFRDKFAQKPTTSVLFEREESMPEIAQDNESVKQPSPSSPIPDRSKRLYLYLLRCNQPPTEDQMQRILSEYHHRFGEVTMLGGQAHNGSLPTEPDMFVVITCLAACKSEGIDFDSDRDQIIYGIDILDGEKFGTCKIQINSS